MTVRLIYCGFLLVLFAGCTLGPDYQQPQVQIPNNWRLSPEQAGQLSNLPFWEQFGDPRLSGLVRDALEQNLDLAVATARMEELMAAYGASRAEQLPQVDALADWSRSAAGGLTTDLRQIQLSSSWEIDLWGRLRRGSEAAKADLLASEAARNSLVLSLAASVATAYIDLRNLDRQLEIARRTADSRHTALELFQLRLGAGLVSPLEVAQIRSEYQATLAMIPPLEQAISERENSLRVLLGSNPGPISRGCPLEQLQVPSVPVAMPSQVLAQRPDIRQAEEDLIAANARIGVARAAYFPTISLTGVLGSASSELTDLLKGPAEIWSLDVPLSIPIFTGGRLRAEEEAARAQHKQALLAYRQTILRAFQEVEDTLTQLRKNRDQLATLEEQLAAQKEYTQLSQLRYEEGYIGFLEILDAQRGLFAVELNYAAEQAALLQSTVQLYKAMGGGWSVPAATCPEPAAQDTGNHEGGGSL